MKKAFVVAALVAASFAPGLPVQAASVTSDEVANCMIFPMFKQECWDKGAEFALAGPTAIAEATSDAVEAADDVVVTPPAFVAPFEVWTCTPAPAGSGYMFDC